MTKRELEELEKAINAIKKHGLEVPLAKELGEASKLLTRLKRLERIRHEILELKQATVAEIRSYQNPPAVVHKVMTATFFLLGHQEKETKVLYSVGSHIHNNYEQFAISKLQMYLLKVVVFSFELMFSISDLEICTSLGRKNRKRKLEASLH